MQKTGGSVTSNYMGGTCEQFLFTYDEGEKQEIEVNKNNASLLFKPKYIIFRPDLLKDGLTINETLVYCFIENYLKDSSDKFYFTNEQIGNIFGFGEQNTSLIIKKLKEKGFIDTCYKLKANGGKIRFIKNLYSDYKNFYSPTNKKFIDNNNKINSNNKINNQDTGNPLPKPESNITPITNRDLTFDNIYNLFYHKSGHKPSLEKCRKVFDSLNLDKEGYEMLVKDLKLFRVEYKYGIKDQMYRPGFEKYVGGFNAEGVNEEYRLKTIIKFHMENAEDIEKGKKRYLDLCESFGKDTIDKLVKEYGKNKNKITLKAD